VDPALPYDLFLEKSKSAAETEEEGAGGGGGEEEEEEVLRATRALGGYVNRRLLLYESLRY
jgi:hypothetical protein